jgi:hypothetical protein
MAVKAEGRDLEITTEASLREREKGQYLQRKHRTRSVNRAVILERILHTLLSRQLSLQTLQSITGARTPVDIYVNITFLYVLLTVIFPAAQFFFSGFHFGCFEVLSKPGSKQAVNEHCSVMVFSQLAPVFCLVSACVL